MSDPEVSPDVLAVQVDSADSSLGWATLGEKRWRCVVGAVHIGRVYFVEREAGWIEHLGKDPFDAICRPCASIQPLECARR